jgi:hypothetical protein
MIPSTCLGQSPYLKALSDPVPFLASAAAVFDEDHFHSGQRRHLVLLGTVVAGSEADLVVGVPQHPL